MKNYLFATIAFCSVANAGTCRWTENGTTHFAEKCPPGVTVEERRHGGTAPLNETPAPSLIIQQGERARARIEAREAASRARGAKWRHEAQIEKTRRQEGARIEKLKKQAESDGFPKSWEEARQRRQARDELDNINRQRAGLPPKSDLERRIDRLEKNSVTIAYKTTSSWKRFVEIDRIYIGIGIHVGQIAIRLLDLRRA